jgi:hypothetical protein
VNELPRSAWPASIGQAAAAAANHGAFHNVARRATLSLSIPFQWIFTKVEGFLASRRSTLVVRPVHRRADWLAHGHTHTCSACIRASISGGTSPSIGAFVRRNHLAALLHQFLLPRKPSRPYLSPANATTGRPGCVPSTTFGRRRSCLYKLASRRADRLQISSSQSMRLAGV